MPVGTMSKARRLRQDPEGPHAAASPLLRLGSAGTLSRRSAAGSRPRSLRDEASSCEQSFRTQEPSRHQRALSPGSGPAGSALRAAQGWQTPARAAAKPPKRPARPGQPPGSRPERRLGPCGPRDASAGPADPSTAAPGTSQRHRRAAWRSRPVPASASRLGAAASARPAAAPGAAAPRAPRAVVAGCPGGAAAPHSHPGGVAPTQPERPGSSDSECSTHSGGQDMTTSRGGAGVGRGGTTPSTGRCMRKPRSRRPRPLSRRGQRARGRALARHHAAAAEQPRRGQRGRRRASCPAPAPAGAWGRLCAASVCQRLPANSLGLLPIFCVRPHFSVVAPSEMVLLRPPHSEHQA